MQKIRLIFILMTSFAVFQLYGRSNSFLSENNSGVMTYENETIDHLNVNGVANLKRTTVQNFLQVNGCLNATGAFIKKMHVNGDATLENCSVDQNSTICGFLNATNSKFKNKLSIASEKVIFIDCTINDLQILKTSNVNKPQIIELKGKTKVNGSIVFEQENGEVFLSKDSTIAPLLKGGKIKKVD